MVGHRGTLAVDGISLQLRAPGEGQARAQEIFETGNIGESVDGRGAGDVVREKDRGMTEDSEICGDLNFRIWKRRSGDVQMKPWRYPSKSQICGDLSFENQKLRSEDIWDLKQYRRIFNETAEISNLEI